MDATSGNIFEQFAREILAEVKATIAPEIRRTVAEEIRRAAKVTYTEAEAAEMLDLAEATLKKIRRRGGIGYSKTAEGKKVYLPEHIRAYAKRHEILI